MAQSVLININSCKSRYIDLRRIVILLEELLMVFNNMLKIDYLDGLRFKHFEGHGYTTDVLLTMSESEALKLLEDVRVALRDGNSQKSVKVSEYEIEIATYGNTALSIIVMQIRGEMSRPLGMFKYDSYMGRKSLLTGVAEVIKDIREEMD